MSDAILTETQVASIVDAFTDSADTIANRIFTVGETCNREALTPKQVFEQVQAKIELAGILTVKGWSSSSVANAKTSYDLYLATGVATRIKRADRNDLAKLIEECRVIHGAKTVRQTIADTTKVYADTITNDDRYNGVMSVLRALRNTPKNDSPAAAGKSVEDRFLAALATAQKLLGEIELSTAQVGDALAIIEDISDSIS